MKRIFSVLAILVFGAITTSCSSDDDVVDLGQYAGGFTMVNAYEGESPLVYVVDNRPVQSPYYALEYKRIGYVNLWQGQRAITVTDAVNRLPLASTLKKIEHGQYYTSFMSGTTDKVNHFITDDKKGEDTRNTTQSGVRFLNLSSDDLVATLQFNTQTLVTDFENREQDTEATVETTQVFKAIDSDSYDLTVLDRDGNVLASREKIELKESQYYTIMFIGAKDNVEKPYYIGIVGQSVN